MLNPSSRRISVHYASLWKSDAESTSLGKIKRSILETDTAENSSTLGRDLSSSDSEKEDSNADRIKDNDSFKRQRSESLSNKSQSEKETDFHETEALKVDSTAENEFADDEDEDPKESARETQQMNAATQRTAKTQKSSEHQKKRNNSSLKKILSIDGKILIFSFIF